MRQIWLIVLAIGFLAGAAGCADPGSDGQAANVAQHPSIERLRMAAPTAFGVERIEIKSVVQAEQAPELFTREGLLSSAYYKYWKADRSAYKVRLNVYESAADLEQGWNKRFPDATAEVVESLGPGYDGFVQGEKIAALRVGAILVEVSASKQPGRLAAFTRGYADYVQQVLAESKSDR